MKAASRAAFSVFQTKPGRNPGKIERLISELGIMKGNTILPYKLAKVYIGDNDWYVEFAWWSRKEERYKREKIRGSGARGLTKRERKSELQDLADRFNIAFKLKNAMLQYHPEQGVEVVRRTLVEWADYFVAKTDWEEKEPLANSTKTTYRMVKSHLEKFYLSNPIFDNSLPVNINDAFVKAFKIYLKSVTKSDGTYLTGKSVNMYLWGLKSILELISTEGLILTIPNIEQYRAKQVKNETDKYPPLTDAEKELVFNYYRKHKKDYYLFLLFVYYTSIRPSELHRIQVNAIDFENETIHVYWYNTKNGLSNFIQLLPPLKRALLEFGVDELNRSWYLFGAQCKPSPTKWEGTNISSDYWEQYRERIGLDKKKMQYGLKHTFNKDYVENNKGNIDWEWLRRHNRHATVKQTQDYISELTAYFIKAESVNILDYHKGEQ